MTHFSSLQGLRSSLFLSLVGLSCALTGGTDQLSAQTPPQTPTVQPPFVDVSERAELDFVHFNGMTGEYYYAEIVGPGVGLFDYDRDGDLDIFLPQGKLLGAEKTIDDAAFQPAKRFQQGGRLYRNELVPSGDLRFTDQTAESGIRANGYGMGVAVGDYDGDGWLDLYLTNLDDNQLLRNEGNGRFTDQTKSAGVEEARWSVSATFFDYDGDSDEDLFVVNYVDFSISEHKPCFRKSSARDYCGPQSYNPWPDRLFSNQGDGTFRDAGTASGIAQLPGAGLGVVVFDANGDTKPDLYVANDGMQNFLWTNQGDGTLSNQALMAGVAVNMSGAAEASMGVDVGDFDNDGDDDIFISHLSRETNTLYVNDGSGGFSDRTVLQGLGPGSIAFTSFGTGWFDFDNDGLLDVFLANGEVKVIEELARQKDPLPIHQRNQLFRNHGERFQQVQPFANATGDLSEVSRGAAFGDIDNDGDTDIVVANNAGPVRLLENLLGNQNSWIGFELVDPRSASGAVNARVVTQLPSGRSLSRRSRRDGSYASANDPRIVVGLLDTQKPVTAVVHWADGSSQTFANLAVNQYHRLKKSASK